MSVKYKRETIFNPSEIKITSDGTIANTHIFINGKELEAISSFSICVSGNANKNRYRPVVVKTKKLIY